MMFNQDMAALTKKTKINVMAILNLTPDSFATTNPFSSDSHNDLSVLREKILTILSQGMILDIGAESTRPGAISQDASSELSRFYREFIPFIQLFDEDTKKLPCTFSIDTYKPEVFLEVSKEINKVFNNANFIFNDVSGVFDEDKKEALRAVGQSQYVYTLTECKTYQDISRHKDLAIVDIPDKELFPYWLSLYEKDLKKLKDVDFYFDPGLGFSKTREQNWLILGSFVQMCSFFSLKKVLLGASRKSFLQNESEQGRAKNESVARNLDQRQAFLVGSILTELRYAKNPLKELVFRVHDFSFHDLISFFQNEKRLFWSQIHDV